MLIDLKDVFNPKTTFGKVFNALIISLIFISLSIIPLHLIYKTGKELDILIFIEKITLTIFTLEYALRIFFAKKPFKYIFSTWGIIDFLAIAPYILFQMGLITIWPAFFLLLRTLRLLKFGRLPTIEAEGIENYEHFSILKNEKLQRIVQKHPIVFLIHILFPLLITSAGLFILSFFNFEFLSVIIIGIVFFLPAILLYIKSWLDYKFDVIFITNKRLIIQRRELFGSTSNNITYDSISDINQDNKGLIKTLLRVGSMTLETSASVAKVKFQYIPQFKEVLQLINQNQQNFLKNKEDNEEEYDKSKSTQK